MAFACSTAENASSSENGPKKLDIWAASSLRSLLPAAVPNANYHFAATSKLARQIEAGACPDVFVSANRQWITRLEKRGVVSAPFRIAQNRLVLAETIPKASRNERIAMANTEVPAGRYAMNALKAQDQWQQLQPRLVFAENVGHATRMLREGHVRQAYLYQSDVIRDARLRIVRTLPISESGEIEVMAAFTTCREHPSAKMLKLPLERLKEFGFLAP